MTAPINVLLIEDNPGDAHLVREYLGSAPSRTDIRLEWADGLMKGMQSLAATKFSAVLLDLDLPDSTGLETLQQVLSHAPGMPVIVMTGQVDEETGIQAVKAGAQDYVIKGQVDGRLLVRLIQHAVQRKQTEVQFAETLAFTEQMLSASPVGILTYRLTGECLSANAHVAEMVGATIEQLKNQNFRALESWKRSGLYDLAEQAIATKKLTAADIHVITTFGKDLWVRAQFVTFQSGGEELLLLTFGDITERKRAEEQIQRQLKRLNALHMIDLAIGSSFDLDIILDVVLQYVISELGVDASAVLLFNPRLQTIEYAASRGFHSDALRRTPLKPGYASQAVLERKIIHVSDFMKRGGQFVRELEAAGEAFVDYYAVPLFIKGGLKGVLEIYHRSYLQANQDWLGFLETLAGQTAIAIDNAQLFETLQRSNIELEQRVAQRTRELNRINAELERANRTKDEFLANMSHELRTPLNSILGLSESLLEERRGSLNDHQHRSLQMIEASGHHLLDLINDILDLSKVEAGMFELYLQPVPLDEFCHSCLALTKAQAGKKSIAVTYRNEAATKRIVADPRRLKQIVVNLLTNAVKFTPQGGHVTLQVNDHPEQDLIRFSVIDDGIGISPEDVKRLFQPFVQVDSNLNRQYEGTGLGLALVQKLTDLHGGSIEVESELGKGSCFTVNLPCKQTQIDAFERPQTQPGLAVHQQPDPAPVETPARRGMILLAEDQRANVVTIGEYLEGHGYEVVVARDGLEAIAKAEAVKPGVILMDIQMPVLDGLEAMVRLRRNGDFASTPIIALTALAMPGDRERCLHAGATDYMSKPVSLKKLRQTIEALMAV
jgi:PAS domain S-box-containing protein